MTKAKSPLPSASCIHSMASGSSSRAALSSPASTASKPTSATSLSSGLAFLEVGSGHDAETGRVEGLEEFRLVRMALEQLGARGEEAESEPGHGRVERIGGVNDDPAGKVARVLADDRFGRRPRRCEDCRLGAPHRLADGFGVALVGPRRFLHAVDDRMAFGPERGAERPAHIARADNGNFHAPLLARPRGVCHPGGFGIRRLLLP